jgi:hypothetical protein
MSMSWDPNLSSSLIVCLQLQKMMMSLPAYHYLLVFFSLVAKDNDEPGSQLVVILDYFLFTCKK